MKLKHTTSLNMVGVDRTQLERFLDAVPREAKFTTLIGQNAADRPGDWETYTVELKAEWES